MLIAPTLPHIVHPWRLLLQPFPIKETTFQPQSIEAYRYTDLIQDQCAPVI